MKSFLKILNTLVFYPCSPRDSEKFFKTPVRISSKWLQNNCSKYLQCVYIEIKTTLPPDVSGTIDNKEHWCFCSFCWSCSCVFFTLKIKSIACAFAIFITQILRVENWGGRMPRWECNFCQTDRMVARPYMLVRRQEVNLNLFLNNFVTN